MVGPISTNRRGIRLPRLLRRSALGLAERALGVIGDPVISSQTTVEGIDHIPQGAAIIAARHCGLLDARLVNATGPRPMTLIDVPVRLSGPTPWGGQVDSETELALRLLGRGELVLVLPEGSRSPDDVVHKGRTGLGALVLAAQSLTAADPVPVVPATVSSTGLSSTISFGPALDFSRHRGLAIDRTLARGVTDEVMTAIAELAGVDYVDSYTSTARDLLKDQARERAQSRRLKAAAQREADRAAIQRQRQRVADEAEDLARRVSEAAVDARHWAERAAQRDQPAGRSGSTASTSGE